MKPVNLAEIRVVNSTERDASWRVEELASGAWKLEFKAHVNRGDKEDCAQSIDWAVNMEKALRAVFPSKAQNATDEIKYLKGELAAKDNENALLKEQLKQLLEKQEEKGAKAPSPTPK